MAIDLAKILAGTEHRIKTVFPFSDESIYLRILNEWDLQQASNHVDKIYKDLKVGFENYDERTAQKTMYELYLAIVDDNGEKLFPDFETFCKACTPEIARRLIEEQNTFQSEVSPDLSNYTKEQLDGTIEELKKKSDRILTISDSRILKKLLQYTVSLLSKPQTGK